MSFNVTPVWTNDGLLAALGTVAQATTVEVGKIDLTGKIGARLFVNLGRAGITAYSANPVEVNVRPLYGSNSNISAGTAGLADRFPFNSQGRVGNSNTAVSTTLSSSVVKGDKVLSLGSGTGFSADDIICIAYNDAAVEFAKVSRVSSNTVYLDSGLLRAHSSGVTVTNCADSFKIDLQGGSVYEVVVDNNKSATGPTLQYMVYTQTYGSDLIQ